MSSISHLNIRALCSEGRLKEAIHILFTTDNPPLDSSTYLHCLQTCIAKIALLEGKQIHSHINDRGFIYATDRILQNKLIHMYGKCGSLVDARKVFDHMTERDVFSWNMVIAAYRKHRLPHEAFTLFHQMQLTTVQPNQFTFSNILPAWAKMGAAEQGMEIHETIIEGGFLSDDVVATGLIDMYTKCRSVEKACQVFDEMPQRNVISWTAIIAGYAQNGLVKKALEIFNHMWLENIRPDSSTFASILSACAKLGVLKQGMEIHRNIIESGFMLDDVVVTNLMDMYAKCGSIEEARHLFDNIHIALINTTSFCQFWNGIICLSTYVTICSFVF